MMPKLLEKIFMFFPTLHLMLIGASGILFLQNISVHTALGFVFTIYLIPLVLWRVIKLKYPLKKGISAIGFKEEFGSPWIVAHRLQYNFITFAIFEKILILIPGLYSLWLRLWGSRIGKGVIWTPNLEVLDRTDLAVGDYCFIGDKSYFSSHFIVRKNNKLILFYDSITVGSKSLIGAHCHLGPGAKVKDLEFLPTYSKMMRGRFVKGNEAGHEL